MARNLVNRIGRCAAAVTAWIVDWTATAAVHVGGPGLFCAAIGGAVGLPLTAWFGLDALRVGTGLGALFGLFAGFTGFVHFGERADRIRAADAVAERARRRRRDAG